MPSISIDASDALRVAADLTKAIAGLDVAARAAVVAGALKIKKGMQADMSASGHFGQAASTISFDLSGNGSFTQAEIGPTKGGAGSISNIAYFGGAHGGGGTVRDPMEPAEEALPEIEKLLDAIVDKLL